MSSPKWSVLLYSTERFIQKHSSNYKNEHLHAKKGHNQQQHRIVAAVSRFCSRCTGWSRHGRNFSCSVARCPPVTHTQTLPVSRNVVTSRCITVLLGTPLSGYALLNAAQRAANDFDVKECSRMSTRSAREYTMFAYAQLLRNGRVQRPSNLVDLNLMATGRGRESP
jgi:hypothetical protein